jgi:hypothetical protein
MSASQEFIDYTIQRQNLENDLRELGDAYAPDKFSDCEICQGIWHQLLNHERTERFAIGIFEHGLSSKCQRHVPLLEAFREHCRTSNPENAEHANVVGFWGQGCLIESVSHGGLIWGLLLVNQNSVPDHPGIGRVLDPDWCDLDTVKEWKKSCLLTHGSKCENPAKISATQPAWLIDIDENCIRPGNECGPYVALSYRWGENPNIRVEPDILASLQQPNSLNDKSISKKLPNILRHAMHLTSVIGERFLWVDALCIIHGHADTRHQLNLMGAIYANAMITIIAADGDSNDGLLGLNGISAPRMLEHKVIPFANEKIIVRNTQTFSMVGNTPYYERGWTYQEFMLSKRRILFNQKEVHWQCQCSLWHEELVLGIEFDKYINPRFTDILSGFPDVVSLDHSINEYNNRNISYDEHALSGIAGLLSIASRSFPGGFLFGNAELMFDRGLCWSPFWKSTNVRRRVHSNRHTDGIPNSAHNLPSWSWTGWQGMVKFPKEAIRRNTIAYQYSETIPITTWYTSSSPKGAPLRRINCTWFDNRDKYKDVTKHMPRGWTRHDIPKEADAIELNIWLDGCSRYIYKHANLKNAELHDNSWFYPFPVADIDESTPMFTPEQTPYLFCKTKRGQLWARPCKEEDSNVAELHTKLGVVIGSLQLHHQEQMKTVDMATTVDPAGMTVDLVAICQTRNYVKTFDKVKQKYVLPIQVKDVYHVLWVEWVDGVAYRLASGVVNKADWDALGLEDISLILG